MRKIKKRKTENKITSEILDNILLENEISANLFIAKSIVIIGILSLFDFLIFGFVSDAGSFEKIVNVFLTIIVLIPIVCGLIAIKIKGRGSITKSMLLIAVLLLSSAVTVYSCFGFWCCLYLPILLSIRYYDFLLTIRISVASTLAMIISSILGLLAGYDVHYLPINAINVPNNVNLFVEDGLIETLYKFNLVNLVDILNDQLIYWAVYLIMYCILTFISLIIVRKGKQNIVNTANLTLELRNKDRDIEEAKMKIMISQLQPHFLYNSLSAIMAIDDNPPETIDALGEFSKYLRGNLDSLKADNLIPFEQELEHVERYISLEELRFGDRINFDFDIKVKNFKIPPLTLQMAIENAVKHGLFNKKDMGCITVQTREDEDNYYVKVIDNGVGFNVNEKKNDGKTHIGLENSKKRIEFLCKGKYIVESEIGNGTTVLIVIPKLKENSL